MENHVPTSTVDSAQEFIPPRHWIGPEELEATYWNDPSVLEKRAQEFHDKPVETIDLIDKLDTKGIARRDFLTIMGASMAMTTLACARRPVHKIIPYVVKPEEVLPGVANWYASSCPDTGEGILIKTREGRPIKLEGNPDHPVNRGAIMPRTQASLLDLYDPERLKEPLRRSRSSGAKNVVSWSEADTAIQSKLKSLVGSGRVRILSGAVRGESTRRLIQEFLTAFGSDSHIEFEPLYSDDVSAAQVESYGMSVVPSYKFDEADYVLSLGSDFLGAHSSAMEYSADWAKGRKLKAKNPAQAYLSKMVCFEPTMTVTGANADERFAIRVGDELRVALAVAHELIVVQKKTRYAGDAAVASALAGYQADAVAQDIGLEKGAEKIKKVARELWDARGKSLVIGGSIQSKTRDAVALQIAVNFLNSALENEGVTVDGTFNPGIATAAGFSGVKKLIGDMQAGRVEVLVVYRSNPAFTLPAAAGFVEAAKKVPLIVVISDREDETGLLSDFVLPDHHYLENWGDARVKKNVVSLQQPAIAPIHSTRAFQDTLLTWGRGAGLNLSGLAGKTISAAADKSHWHEYLRANWNETYYREVGSAGNFEQFWEGALRAGVLNLQSARGIFSGKPSARPFKTSALAALPKYKEGSKDLCLALYSKVSMTDGRQANNAWLQELPDPISTITWDNYLNVGTGLAKQYNLKTNDVVEVTTDQGSVELPVNVQPGLHSSVVTVAVGYGRRAVGKVGNGAGVDVFPLVGVEKDQLIYAGASVKKFKKTGRFYKLAATQWHNSTENRPIINDITFAEYKRNPAQANHTDPHLKMDTVPTMWPVHEYKGHRWGMAIDLNSCTGCGACVIGCQAENNIPVVGRDQVRVSREMHWIRIDRYYSGSAENPEVVFQPMLCQHCENAPCETVCPVLATVHNDEGLNEQVYNRCVGTRYCQNNCPYKTRRFNFFDHWKSYEGTLNLVWNPDITVRTRGIMEKCTFCVQRIKDGKDAAKDLGEKVKDGQIKTACQQACPTEAIVFGDMNDPKSRISELKADPRAFRVLEILNTKPSISYLTKVRNKEGSAEHHGNANGHGGSHST